MFFVADEEVLSDSNPFSLFDSNVSSASPLVKCVKADYEAAEHVPRNTRLGWGQRYLGWMLMKCAEVVELWKELELNDLQRIAPKRIGGSHLVVWENVVW